MGTIIGEGITFDDVLLVPQYSEVTPNMIDLKTHLTKKIVLNITNERRVDTSVYDAAFLCYDKIGSKKTG